MTRSEGERKPRREEEDQTALFEWMEITPEIKEQLPSSFSGGEQDLNPRDMIVFYGSDNSFGSHLLALKNGLEAMVSDPKAPRVIKERTSETSTKENLAIVLSTGSLVNSFDGVQVDNKAIYFYSTSGIYGDATKRQYETSREMLLDKVNKEKPLLPPYPFGRK
jgi:hypothetical protein